MNTQKNTHDNMETPRPSLAQNANDECYNRLKDLSNTEIRMMIFSLCEQVEKGKLELNRLKRRRDMLMQENEELKAKKLNI